MAHPMLPPFFLRVRVCCSLISAFVLNLSMVQHVPWLGRLIPSFAQKTLCNPGMNCHGCPWAIGACPVGVMAYGSAVQTLPVYAIASVLFLTAVLGRLTCAFLCPFGLLQDILYRIPFFKVRLPRFMRYGKYLALALLVVLFPLLLGFEQSGYLRVDKPKVDKATEGDDALTSVDVKVTVTNLGPKPVTNPQMDLVYLDAGKTELFRERKEFPGVTVPPGESVTLDSVRVPNRLGEGDLRVTSPQSEVQQNSPYQLYYCRLCPVGTLEATLPSHISGTSAGSYGIFSGRALRISILVGFLVLMLVVSRPFCRTFCPAGAIYALFSGVALARMSLDKDACVHCNACSRVCPVDLDVPKEVGGAECIACGDCMQVCPKSGIRRSFGL
jgi:ferredoxin